MICFARLKRGAFFYRSISLQQPVVGVCPQGRLGLRNTPSLDRIDQLVDFPWRFVLRLRDSHPSSLQMILAMFPLCQNLLAVCYIL